MESKNLMSVLTANYMLASLSVRTWTGTSTDNDATAELTHDKGAVDGSARVIKKLLAGYDEELKATLAAYAQVRLMFYARTLPWSSASEGKQRGARLVACSDAVKFLADFKVAKDAATKALDAFIAVYNSRVASAATTLGQLYDATQYPSEAKVRSCFSAEMKLVPISDTGDFSRLSVPAKLADGLRAMYERNAAAEVENALSDLRDRMCAELTRMHTQLSKEASGEKTRLHKTLTENLRGIVQLARNMAPVDAEIGRIADKIDSDLLVFEVSQLKGNATLSREVATRAQAIAHSVRAPAQEAAEAPVSPTPLPEADPEPAEAQAPAQEAEEGDDSDEDNPFAALAAAVDRLEAELEGELPPLAPAAAPPAPAPAAKPAGDPLTAAAFETVGADDWEEPELL